MLAPFTRVWSREVSKSYDKYPKWFSEDKTTLIPKEGEFLSENQRLITCLNNMYKWFTSCLLAPIDQHLKLWPDGRLAKRSEIRVFRYDA